MLISASLPIRCPINVIRYRHYSRQAMRIHPQTPPENEADAACRICGAVTEMTFEHFPPRSAGNRQPIEMHDITAWLGAENKDNPGKGRISQKGSGAYSLCEECNNRTGRIYVPELAKWVRYGNAALCRIDPQQYDSQIEPAYFHLDIEDVRPGRFVKQVVTMLLALSIGGVARKHSDLRDYVRDPAAIGLPDRYRLFLVLYPGPGARFNGGSVEMRKSGMVFSLELAFPPFAYALSIDADSPAIETGDITAFADHGIDVTAKVSMQLRLGFGHTPFPLDFRSQAALDRDVARNEADAQRLGLA